MCDLAAVIGDATPTSLIRRPLHLAAMLGRAARSPKRTSSAPSGLLGWSDPGGSKSLFQSAKFADPAAEFAVLIPAHGRQATRKSAIGTAFYRSDGTNGCQIFEKFAVCREFAAETSPYRTGSTASHPRV
jgi:hypothetical protein